MNRGSTRAHVCWVLAASTLCACATSVGTPIEQAQDLRRHCHYDEARRLIDAHLPNMTGAARVDALLVRGFTDESAGDLPKALESYRAAVSVERVPEAWHLGAERELGMASARARDFPAAIQNLLAVIEGLAARAPKPGAYAGTGWETHAALATALAESGRYAEAVTQFDAALVRNPGSSWLSRQRAEAERARAATTQAPPPGTFWQAAYGGEQLLSAAREEFGLAPTYRVAATYPRHALRERVQGFVIAHVTVDAEGRVTNLRVAESEPPGVFDSAALESLRHWRFQPRIVDCASVPGEGLQRIDFRMSD